MKKLLLTLVVAFSFGSAFAEKNLATESFFDKKTPSTLKVMLGEKKAHTKSGYQCEQNCWDNRRICIKSGENFTLCSQALMQCLDRCEGAGGLY